MSKEKENQEQNRTYKQQSHPNKIEMMIEFENFYNDEIKKQCEAMWYPYKHQKRQCNQSGIHKTTSSDN